jgi:hypothetical protein
MADAKPAGKGISKRLGPLPYWGWGLVLVGGYLGYRYIKAREAADEAAVASGTTGGTLIPNDVGLPSTSTVGGAGTFSSLAGWEQAMLTFLTGNGLDSADALNGVNAWLNGNCVSQAAYNAIAAALVSSSVGLPPGYTTLPTLSVCPAAQQSTSTGGGSTTPAPAQPTLPYLNAQLYPLKVLYGDYNPGAYTEIGTVQNGVYTGEQVAGGAPVYANVFGGFVQDFDEATLPNGTGIYVPTDLLDYVYTPGHTPVTAPAP